MIRRFCALVALCLAAPIAAAVQVHTSPVELIDASPETPGIIIQRAVLAPPVARGVAVKSCGKAGALWTYVRLADACPATASALAAPRLAAPEMTIASTKMMRSGYAIRNARASLGTVGRIDGKAAGIVITDVETRGATYLLRSYRFTDQAPSLTVARVRMLDNGPGGILVRGASSGTIEDVLIEATRPETDCSKVPEGVALAGKAGGDTGGPWTIARVRVTGIRSVGCKFANGDGFSIERGWQNISLIDSYAADNSDAGFDIKSPTARLDRTIAERNRRSYKLWADQRHGHLTSIDPGQPGSGAAAHLQVHGSRTIRIEHLEARSSTTAPIVQVEGASKAAPARVSIGSCSLKVPAGTKMAVGPVVLDLGPGCAL
ncbi:MAG: hypothetical protein PGN09_07645 [Sphingomonas fennica]